MSALQHPPIGRIGVVVKRSDPRARAVAARLVEWAASRDVELLGDAVESWDGERVTRVSAEELAARADLLIVLGGDGTMIATARLVGGRGTPVLGVNFGTLGFLTEFTDEELFPALEGVCAGAYAVDPRVMIGCSVLHEGREIARDVALNDVVVNKTALARIIEIDCWVDGQYVTYFRADGLIISSPTGSTAYNLSAGGPILMPSMGAFVINPICPHTLSNRPLVVPDSVTVDLHLRTRDEGVMITVDGQVGHDLQAGDRVRIVKSTTTFNVITPKDRSFFQALRDKLRWGGQIPAPECD